MARKTTPARRPRSNSRSDTHGGSTTTKGPPPRAKRSKTGDAETQNEAPKHVLQLSNQDDAAEDEEVLHILVNEKDRRVRKRALDLLRGVDLDASQNNGEDDEFPPLKQRVELPVLYGALKIIKEIGQGNAHEEESDLTEDDRQLIEDASLAVPYLMYKRFYEQLMLPRTMGGLAFSDAKAMQVARDLFLAMGPACCKETVTDQQLSEACPSVKRIDARKILPSLHAIGKEARSQLEQVEALLHEGEEEDDEEEDVESDFEHDHSAED